MATNKNKQASSQAQMAQRVQFSNLASTYQTASYVIRGAYEPKPNDLSFYNMFVKYNLGKVKVYLTKEESEAKACVVAPYNITRGTLRPIFTEARGNILVTSIALLEGFVIADTTTAGEVSDALLNANSFMREGDQLPVIHFVQKLLSSAQLPDVSLKLHEFFLERNSTIPFYKLIPQSLFFVTDNYVGTDANAETGGMAYVLSRKVAGKLLISTQSIVLTPGNTLYAKYSSEEKKKEAIESYGATTPYYFDADDKSKIQDIEIFLLPALL
jgi:hypothetical protein